MKKIEILSLDNKTNYFFKIIKLAICEIFLLCYCITYLNSKNVGSHTKNIYDV